MKATERSNSKLDRGLLVACLAVGALIFVAITFFHFRIARVSLQNTRAAKDKEASAPAIRRVKPEQHAISASNPVSPIHDEITTTIIVVDDRGAPIDHALVQGVLTPSRYTKSSDLLPVGETGADGRVVCVHGGRSPSLQRLYVSASGFASESISISSDVESIKVTLLSGHDVVLHCADAAGAPISGVRIAVYRASPGREFRGIFGTLDEVCVGTLGSKSDCRVGLSDERGDLVFHGLRQGKYQVFARAPELILDAEDVDSNSIIVPCAPRQLVFREPWLGGLHVEGDEILSSRLRLSSALFSTSPRVLAQLQEFESRVKSDSKSEVRLSVLPRVNQHEPIRIECSLLLRDSGIVKRTISLCPLKEYKGPELVKIDNSKPGRGSCRLEVVIELADGVVAGISDVEIVASDDNLKQFHFERQGDGVFLLPYAKYRCRVVCPSLKDDDVSELDFEAKEPRAKLTFSLRRKLLKHVIDVVAADGVRISAGAWVTTSEGQKWFSNSEPPFQFWLPQGVSASVLFRSFGYESVTSDLQSSGDRIETEPATLTVELPLLGVQE